MLPQVLRVNHAVNAGKQARVSEALERPEQPAGEAVAGLGLGLPTRLRDVGVKTGAARHHRQWVDARPLYAYHPRKINCPAVIRTLLDAAW